MPYSSSQPVKKRKVGVAPEGAGVIALSAIIVVVCVVISVTVPEGRLLWLPALAAILFLGVIYFFRDPQRFPPSGHNLILAPADGRVIGIEHNLHDDLLTFRHMVSIFMSPLDVHINRSPVEGRVVSVEHKPGKFHTAFQEKAARENEQVLVIIESMSGKIALRQVAGYIARRIVCHLQPGDRVKMGDRIGMIRFGSRVDLFLPDNISIVVKVGDRVVGGESVVALWGEQI